MLGNTFFPPQEPIFKPAFISLSQLSLLIKTSQFWWNLGEDKQNGRKKTGDISGKAKAEFTTLGLRDVGFP